MRKEDRLPARQRCGRIGCCISTAWLSPAFMAFLLAANVLPSAAEELCGPLQEAVKTPGLLQAKSALWTKSLDNVEESNQDVRHPRRHSPITSRFFGLEGRDSRLSLSTVWPLLALTILFLLFTFILVNHEALLKRFGEAHAERGVPDSKVPLEPEAAGDFCPDLIVPAGCAASPSTSPTTTGAPC